MELTISKQPVNVMEMLYEGTAEQPLECDVLLPDYCPDIQRILRCEVTLSLLSWKIQGDKAILDGMAVAHLYYVDIQGCLRHTEYKIPYSKTLDLRTEPIKPVVDITQTMDYFNCRAVSPRRLDMRGAASINCRITGQNEQQVVCNAQGQGIELRQDNVETVRLLPCMPQRTEVHEDVELGLGKPAVGEVIRLSASGRVVDYKVISGKIVLKGEVIVHILYRSADDETVLETMEYTLPISQVMDVDGLEEDCDCTVWYEICDTGAQLKRGDNGDNTLLTLNIAVNAMAKAVKRTNMEAACDCYSTECECRQEQKQVPILEYLGAVSELCTIKETLDSQPVKAMVDLWCVIGSVNSRPQTDTITVTGKILLCMIARNNKDELFYYEHPSEFSKDIAISHICENIQFTPKAMVDNVSFSMNGEQPEVRCNITLFGEIYGRRTKQLLCGIEADMSHKKERRENMLFLYFANDHESLWDVAKRYNTSVGAIQKGNEIDNMMIDEKTMLLIPMQ